MAIKLPPLLLGVVNNITDLERSRLKAISRSWMTLSRSLHTMGEADLLKVLVLELQDQRRPIIVARCLSRFRTVRERRENQELFDCADDVATKMMKERRRVHS
jgi:hypothetical protein